MATPLPERAGVLVLRAWIEGEPPSVRLRITQTVDLEGGEEQSRATTSIDEACAIVRRWLDEFVGRA